MNELVTHMNKLQKKDAAGVTFCGALFSALEAGGWKEFGQRRRIYCKMPAIFAILK